MPHLLPVSVVSHNVASLVNSQCSRKVGFWHIDRRKCAVTQEKAMNRTDTVTVLPHDVTLGVNPGRHRARGAGKRHVNCLEPASKSRTDKRQAKYQTEYPKYTRNAYADHGDLLRFSVDSVGFENAKN